MSIGELTRILKAARQVSLVHCLDNGSFIATLKENWDSRPSIGLDLVTTESRDMHNPLHPFYPIFVYWQKFKRSYRGYKDRSMIPDSFLVGLEASHPAPAPEMMEAVADATLVRQYKNIPNINTFSTMPNPHIMKIMQRYTEWKSKRAFRGKVESAGYSLPSDSGTKENFTQDVFPVEPDWLSF